MATSSLTRLLELKREYVPEPELRPHSRDRGYDFGMLFEHHDH